MRYLLWMFLLISGSSLAAQPGDTLDREKCERIIQKQFPEFHILREDDFPDMYKGRFRDGQIGSLLYGNFDPDDNLDFAALLIGEKLNDNSYDGMIAICHGDKNGNFACKKMLDALHYAEEDNVISLARRGIHNCIEGEDQTSEITLQFDTIGSYSEKGGGIYVPQPNGTYDMCVTSD